MFSAAHMEKDFLSENPGGIESVWKKGDLSRQK